MIRRLVVLGALIVVIIGVVSVVRSLVDSDSSNAASGSDPSTTATATATSLPGVVTASSAAVDPTVTTVDPAGTSTTLTTTPDPGTVPTAADPARILLVGDSEAGGLSPFLKKMLDPTGVTALTTDYKVSTGLVRADFYDWPAHLQATLPAENPDIVVALFGGNDGQGFLSTDTSAGAAAGKAVDSDAWRAEYAKRVGAMMDYLSADGRTLIWVGVPNGQDPSLTAALKIQNDVVKLEVASHPNVKFVDSWDTFSGIDGGFAPYVVDPRDGEAKPVRSTKDGFHLNTTGEEILAFNVSAVVTTELKARGAAI
ncbi:MAG: hypothetical protein JWM34_283 [Ilumatobacteraceae bacterium]|nr:hypothetical protein [Ilumatobacteraceae bacterium]